MSLSSWQPTPYKLESFWLPDGVYAWKTLMHEKWIIFGEDKGRYVSGPLGETIKARCYGGVSHGISRYPTHEPPSMYRHGATPGCGFYAMKMEYTPEPMLNKALLIRTDPQFTEPYFDDMPRNVLAVVRLSGTIIEHDNGFRASEQTILEYGPEWEKVRPYNSLLTRTIHARKLVKWFNYIRKEYSNG